MRFSIEQAYAKNFQALAQTVCRICKNGRALSLGSDASHPCLLNHDTVALRGWNFRLVFWQPRKSAAGESRIYHCNSLSEPYNMHCIFPVQPKKGFAWGRYCFESLSRLFVMVVFT